MPAFAPVDKPVLEPLVDEGVGALKEVGALDATIDKPVLELLVDEGVGALDDVGGTKDEVVDVDTKSVAWNRICTPYVLMPSPRTGSK
jgi:hypothetical protein